MLLCCLVWPLFLWMQFGGVIPYLDSGIDFLQAYDFYSGGLPALISHWASLHPPFKMTVVSILFFLFGSSSRAYALFGLLLGWIASCAYFVIVTKTIKSFWMIAGMMMIFLLYPLGVAGTIGGFTDYALFTWCLVAWAGYISNNTVVVFIASLCAVLTKEPGVFLPASLIIAELIQPTAIKRKIQWKFLISLAFTPVALFIWVGILSWYGKGAWSDHILAVGHFSNGMIASLQNISSGGWNNPYAFQNMLHVFVMNFQWVYWLVAIVGILLALFFCSKRPKHHPGEALLPAAIFAFLYIVFVLSFPTYAIPRYVLPVSASLLVFLLYSLRGYWFVHISLSVVCWLIVCGVSVMGLFFSIDPVSLGIWKTLTLENQTLYNMRDERAGNDGITYNIQEALLVKSRTKQIQQGLLQTRDCYQWKLYDPRNDKRIFSLFGVRPGHTFIDCLR